jgi:hypothetical protein
MWGWDVSLIKSPTNKNGETPTDKRDYHIKRNENLILIFSLYFYFEAHISLLLLCPRKPAAFEKYICRGLEKLLIFSTSGTVLGHL